MAVAPGGRWAGSSPAIPSASVMSVPLRESSTLKVAPSKSERFEIHIQTMKMITPAIEP